MCTVSVIRPLVPALAARSGDDAILLRLVVNRDEQRQRAAASPPVTVITPSGRALMPTDPQGGGTWVAASESGLLFTLLNGQELPARVGPPAGRCSRGLVIPHVLASRSLDEALIRAQTVARRDFQPWRLIATDGTRLLDVQSRSGGRVRHMKGLLPARFMATSSSVRADEAARARHSAFRDALAVVSATAQDRFHAGRGQDDPALGVLMEREDARTVSRTVVEVAWDRIVMHYEALGDHGLAGRWTTTLDRARDERGAA